MASRNFTNAPSLSTALVREDLVVFMKCNYTKAERQLLVELTKDIVFNDDGDTYQTDMDITPYVIKRWQYSYFQAGGVSVNKLYTMIWLPYTWLYERYLNEDYKTEIMKRILDWKFKVDLTEKERKNIVAKKVSEFIDIIRQLRDLKERGSLVTEKYTKDELESFFKLLHEDSPFNIKSIQLFSEFPTEKNFQDPRSCSYHRTVDFSQYVRDVMIKALCKGIIDNPSGCVPRRWCYKTSFYKDLQDVLLKPISDMPLYINRTLIKGFAAKWRLANGK